MKNYAHTCEICHKHFASNQPHQKTCSVECRAEHEHRKSKEYSEAYYIRNKREENLRSKKFRLAHPNYMKEYMKEYRKIKRGVKIESEF